jgi:DNA-binding beta-propeller fold protein YncE
MYNDTPVLREPVQVFVNIPPTMLGNTVTRIDVEDKVRYSAFNSSEEMLVTAGDKIIIFDKNGKKLYSFTNQKLKGASGLAVDGSNVYVTDITNGILLKFDETGKLLKSVGQKGGGEGEFDHPIGLTVVGDEVIVCDSDNHRLQVFTSDLVFLQRIGSRGKGNGQFLHPLDVTHDEHGNLYVSDGGNNRVQIFDAQGKFLRTLMPPGHITRPFGIIYSRNLVYITQWVENGKVHVYHKNGSKVYSIPYESNKNSVCGVAVDVDGFIYICDSDRHQVIVF